MSGLRDRNKARRREAILDAALELLEGHDLESVTVEQIAERADVSPPTVYNLVGTRDQLLGALVDRVLNRLVEDLSAMAGDEGSDPFEDARFIVESSADAFIAESRAYRQIMRGAHGLSPTAPRAAFDPSQLQVDAMRRAQDLGLIRDDLDAGGLGRQIYLSYVAAMQGWANGMLGDRGFRLASLHGLAVVIAAASTDRYRDRAIRELADLSDQLSRTHWRAR